MKKAVSADAPLTLWGRIIRPGLPGSTTLPALMVLTLLQALSAHAQPPQVVQRGYDANVSGANLSETTLNTSNVVPGSFGLVFTLSVNDNIMAQPLYVPGVTINGTSHNVVYVATMSDTLYAFDADVGGAPLWTTNLATYENATPVPLSQFAYSGNTNIVGNLGILSTPVINPSTNTLYAVACTLENATMVYRLHAVNIMTGTPLTSSGMVIAGTYRTITFDARNEWQRSSLVLVGTNVVFGFGALEAESTANLYSGWVMAYNTSTLAQTGIFATETSGNGGGGVWDSGRPPAVDGSGNVYVFSGNGYISGYDGVNNFSETVLKLNPANGLSLADWFTPSNWSTLDSGDVDLGSSGPMLVPGTSLLAGGGKAGVLYVLNPSGTIGLGHETSTDSGALQEITIAAGSLRGGPVYWQNANGPVLYDWGSNDALKAFPFNGSTFATTPSATGSVTEAYPGGILTLSANGSTPGTGVVWATVSTSGNAFNLATPGALYAFDAGNVATQLWNSNMRPADSLGTFAKLVPPLVVNGRVYVATGSQQVDVYGLLSTAPPAAAAPTFSPAPGTYSAAQSVTLSSTTPGFSIYYTTNGTTPTVNSTLYNGAIAVNGSMTIEAIAVASGYSASPVASGAYVINIPGTTEVSLSGSANVDGVVANGTAVPSGGLDGDGYAYSATLLGSSLIVNGNTYAFGNAGVADAVSNTTIALPAGNYTTLSLLGTAVNGNRVNQTFTVNYNDGTSTNFTQSMSDWFSPQNYAGETKALQMAYRVESNGALDNRTFYLYGYSFALNGAKTLTSLTLPKTRNVIVLAVDVSGATNSPPPAAAPTFQPAAGTYSTAQSVTLSSTTPGFSIYYTTNGTTPTVNSTLYTGAVAVNSSMTIEAIAVASGYSASPVASGAYVIAPPAAAPTFQPAPGTYSTAQSVTLSSTTPGFNIYYTTNGTTPTVNSTPYTGAIAVNASMTIEAIAVASGYSASPVASGAYLIAPPAAAPTFQPAPGTYSAAQSVALSSTTPGFSIYYTTNGTTPTVNSTLYTGAVAVNSSMTIEAIAVAIGYSTSPVASGAYVIGTPATAPTFSPPGGTYTATQMVTLSSTTPGFSIYYTTNGTTPTVNSTPYTGVITVSSSMTIEAIAVASGYLASPVASAAYVINTGTTTEVPLTGSVNVDGIVANGSAVPNKGLDNDGYAYSATLVGTSLNWNGNTYAFGSAGVADAVSNTTIALPAGNYTTLSLLGTAVNGNRASQTFTVTYSDGSSTNFTQSMSDWFSPQNYAGESIVLPMAYRVEPNGALDNRTFNLYGYSFALNGAKTVSSLTLPKTRNVIVLAVDVQ